MIPSLRFFADILPIRLLIPGTWLAAVVIRRLMLASVSLCRVKLSLTAYAWLNTLSAMLWLLSTRFLSWSMYSASAASGLFARYSSMSDRTFVNRLARSRACCRAERSRVSSRLWVDSFSLRRTRLFCLRAEEVRADSDSRSCASLPMTESRYDNRSANPPADETRIRSRYGSDDLF